MSLFFLSGGGRYGNQLINIYHLLAISIEYNLTIYKLNDSYFVNKENIFPFFKIDINKKDNWSINLFEKPIFIEYLLKINYRILILFIHFLFFVIPYLKSFKYKPHKYLNKYIIANNIRLDLFLDSFISNCFKGEVVFSGYGLRDYRLLTKHKQVLTNYMKENLNSSLAIESLDCLDSNFLFVHIRRTDFLKIDSYEKLNFSNSEWIHSIIKLTKEKKLKNVVLFSDEHINKSFIEELFMNNLKVIIPETKHDINFLKLFFNYIKKAKFVLCNGSSLSITLSFLFREYVFFPTEKKSYEKLKISKLFLDPLNSKLF